MDKAGIIEIISIEFKLSYTESKNAVDEIFTVINECLLNGDSFDLPKLGKFKIYNKKQDNEKTADTVKFIASEKITEKINSDFDNLKKVKLKTDASKPEEYEDNFDFKISDEFKKILIENHSEESNVEIRKTPDTVKSGMPRPIISGKVIDLHNEIINSKENREK